MAKLSGRWLVSVLNEFRLQWDIKLEINTVDSPNFPQAITSCFSKDTQLAWFGLVVHFHSQSYSCRSCHCCPCATWGWVSVAHSKGSTLNVLHRSLCQNVLHVLGWRSVTKTKQNTQKRFYLCVIHYIHVIKREIYTPILGHFTMIKKQRTASSCNSRRCCAQDPGVILHIQHLIEFTELGSNLVSFCWKEVDRAREVCSET